VLPGALGRRSNEHLHAGRRRRPHRAEEAPTGKGKGEGLARLRRFPADVGHLRPRQAHDVGWLGRTDLSCEPALGRTIARKELDHRPRDRWSGRAHTRRTRRAERQLLSAGADTISLPTLSLATAETPGVAAYMSEPLIGASPFSRGQRRVREPKPLPPRNGPPRVRSTRLRSALEELAPSPGKTLDPHAPSPLGGTAVSP
jgi:hypothetical protein